VNRGRAFTLVELLVVMAILALLAGLAMPLLALAQRGAKRSATQAVMSRVDVALRQFRDEVGAWPWQEDYGDFSPGVHPLNRLGRRLGTDLSALDLANLNDDADLAVAQYAYILHSTTLAENVVGAQAFRTSDVRTDWKKIVATNSWAPTGARNPPGTAIMLNRMGAERARRAVLAGELGLTGVRMANTLSRNDGKCP
jgi:prepilin-type N-terminal cleavage/methylation domain-containing protein